jgi:DNA-binding MarR family transcriptional regulator
MSAQMSLFDSAPLARKRDPQTSAKAAQRALNFVGGHEGKIHAALNGPGLTYREIARATGMEPVAVARRLKGMESRGLIRRDGEREGMTVWHKA